MSNFNQEIHNFRESFTHTQKAAVLASMMIISTSTGCVLKEEQLFIQKIADDLGISPNDPEFMSMPEKGRAGLALVSNNLSKSNKEWFSYALYTLLAQKGQPDERKLEIALAILSDIGIDEGEFIRIVQFTSRIYNRFAN